MAEVQAVTDIWSAFRGRHMFITGGSGFLGKVFIFKVLKEFPDIGSLNVLIRAKKGQSPQDRLQREVFGSPCFDSLKKQLGAEEFARRAAKVVPVVGDVMHDRLGIAPAEYEALTQRVNYIVHLAATVNFTEKFNIAAEMNILGAVRVLAFAQKCKKLDAFVHTSTCYVNWNRHGRDTPVREVLYPLPFDPEAMCKALLTLQPDEVEAKTEELLKLYNYPNTYTFTKSVAEHILVRRRGNVPLTIVRPAIVGSALVEPTPGWVDVLTAAGGLIFMSGMGLLHELNIEPDFIADIVPVDYVVNTLLKAVYKTAVAYKNGAPATGASTDGSAAVATTGARITDASGRSMAFPVVFQSCTSDQANPLTWATTARAVLGYYTAHPPPKQVEKCELVLMPNRTLFRAKVLLRRTLPLEAVTLLSHVPGVMTPKQKADLQKLRRTVNRLKSMDSIFASFTTYQWRYSFENTAVLDAGMSPAERSSFSTDVAAINWHAYMQAYCFGLVRYFMKAADSRPAPVVPESGSVIFNRAAL